MNIIAHYHVARLDILLHKTAQHIHRLVFLQHRATTLTDNLHIDTVTGKLHKLVAGQVCLVALSLEGGLVNYLNAMFCYEGFDSILLFLLHVRVGLIILATSEYDNSHQQGNDIISFFRAKVRISEDNT